MADNTKLHPELIKINLLNDVIDGIYNIEKRFSSHQVNLDQNNEKILELASEIDILTGRQSTQSHVILENFYDKEDTDVSNTDVRMLTMKFNENWVKTEGGRFNYKKNFITNPDLKFWGELLDHVDISDIGLDQYCGLDIDPDDGTYWMSTRTTASLNDPTGLVKLVNFDITSSFQMNVLKIVYLIDSSSTGYDHSSFTIAYDNSVKYFYLFAELGYVYKIDSSEFIDGVTIDLDNFESEELTVYVNNIKDGFRFDEENRIALLSSDYGKYYSNCDNDTTTFTSPVYNDFGLASTIAWTLDGGAIVSNPEGKFNNKLKITLLGAGTYGIGELVVNPHGTTTTWDWNRGVVSIWNDGNGGDGLSTGSGFVIGPGNTGTVYGGPNAPTWGVEISYNNTGNEISLYVNNSVVDTSSIPSDLLAHLFIVWDRSGLGDGDTIKVFYNSVEILSSTATFPDASAEFMRMSIAAWEYDVSSIDLYTSIDEFKLWDNNINWGVILDKEWNEGNGRLGWECSIKTFNSDLTRNSAYDINGLNKLISPTNYMSAAKIDNTVFVKASDVDGGGFEGIWAIDLNSFLFYQNNEMEFASRLDPLDTGAVTVINGINGICKTKNNNLLELTSNNHLGNALSVRAINDTVLAENQLAELKLPVGEDEYMSLCFDLDGTWFVTQNTTTDNKLWFWLGDGTKTYSVLTGDPYIRGITVWGDDFYILYFDSPNYKVAYMDRTTLEGFVTAGTAFTLSTYDTAITTTDSWLDITTDGKNLFILDNTAKSIHKYSLAQGSSAVVTANYITLPSGVDYTGLSWANSQFYVINDTDNFIEVYNEKPNPIDLTSGCDAFLKHIYQSPLRDQSGGSSLSNVWGLIGTIDKTEGMLLLVNTLDAPNVMQCNVFLSDRNILNDPNVLTQTKIKKRYFDPEEFTEELPHSLIPREKDSLLFHGGFVEESASSLVDAEVTVEVRINTGNLKGDVIRLYNGNDEYDFYCNDETVTEPGGYPNPIPIDLVMDGTQTTIQLATAITAGINGITNSPFTADNASGTSDTITISFADRPTAKANTSDVSSFTVTVTQTGFGAFGFGFPFNETYSFDINDGELGLTTINIPTVQATDFLDAIDKVNAQLVTDGVRAEFYIAEPINRLVGIRSLHDADLTLAVDGGAVNDLLAALSITADTYSHANGTSYYYRKVPSRRNCPDENYMIVTYNSEAGASILMLDEFLNGRSSSGMPRYDISKIRKKDFKLGSGFLLPNDGTVEPNTFVSGVEIERDLILISDYMNGGTPTTYYTLIDLKDGNARYFTNNTDRGKRFYGPIQDRNLGNGAHPSDSTDDDFQMPFLDTKHYSTSAMTFEKEDSSDYNNDYKITVFALGTHVGVQLIKIKWNSKNERTVYDNELDSNGIFVDQTVGRYGLFIAPSGRIFAGESTNGGELFITDGNAWEKTIGSYNQIASIGNSILDIAPGSICWKTPTNTWRHILGISTFQNDGPSEVASLLLYDVENSKIDYI